MKPNTYAKRSRHHSNPRGRTNQQFSAPLSDSGDHYDQRMKATAQQQLTKYLNMARDAASSGDRVAAEGYYQHADHYQRVLNTFRPPVRAPQAPLPEVAKDALAPDVSSSEVVTETVAAETVVAEPKPKAPSRAPKPVKEEKEAVQPPEDN